MKGFFPGLLGGFGLFLVFGFLASLTMSSSITNLFTMLAGISIIACPIIGFINGRKERAAHRKQKVDEQAKADRIKKSLEDALATMNLGCGVTQETFARYAKACDNMVALCSFYYFEPRYKSIIMPYYQAVYNRTWPVYDWRNGRYEHIIGIELADVLHREIETRAQEREEEYKRKQSYNSY